MYDDVYESKNVTDRRETLDIAVDAEKKGLYRGGLRIDSISGYKNLPKIKPLDGREIRFYEDGIEAVVSENIGWGAKDKVICNGILVDEKRKQVIKFHFDKPRKGTGSIE